jgi:hypothetical protein
VNEAVPTEGPPPPPPVVIVMIRPNGDLAAGEAYLERLTATGTRVARFAADLASETGRAALEEFVSEQFGPRP